LVKAFLPRRLWDQGELAFGFAAVTRPVERFG
jgi:hypothetical protein